MPQQVKNTVNDLSVVSVVPGGTKVAFNVKQAKASWHHSFLSFLPETSKLKLAVYSYGSDFA